MRFDVPRVRSCAVGLTVAMSLAAFTGCSGETSAPTKIYEGGGTIPEITEQPEKAEKPVKNVKASGVAPK